MIKRQEARALRYALNLINYHFLTVFYGYSAITDMSDIYPLGTATVQDVGYTWSITTASGYNLVSGITADTNYRNCFAMIDNSTGFGVVYFKIDPTDKTAVSIAGIIAGDDSIAEYDTFNNEIGDFPTLMEFESCVSDCDTYYNITVTFPKDTEASDIQLDHYNGYSDTTNYSIFGLAAYFAAHFSGLGFGVRVNGETLTVIYNQTYKPTDGISILDSVVFTVLGAGAPYPYNLDTNPQQGTFCCPEPCYKWPLPVGKRFAGIGLTNETWHWAGLARMQFTECDCGSEMQDVNNQPFAVPLTDGRTAIFYDFTNDYTGNDFSFSIRELSHEAGAYVQEINEITTNNNYGYGSANFGRFTGTSGDASVDVVSGTGWSLTANDEFTGNTEILYNGQGSSCLAGASGTIWSLPLTVNNPVLQLYLCDIYFYAKDVMPTDIYLKAFVTGDTGNFASLATVLTANTIYKCPLSFIVNSGAQNISIGLKLVNILGNDLPLSTGVNDFVTVYAYLRRSFISPQNALIGYTKQVFENCNSCYIHDYLHENTQLENGFPGNLVGGWDIAFPVELAKESVDFKKDRTTYRTSDGFFLELNSQSDKQTTWKTNWITENQLDFLFLAFGLSPFMLDAVQVAEAESLSPEYDSLMDMYNGSIVLSVDGWNKSRSLC